MLLSTQINSVTAKVLLLIHDNSTNFVIIAAHFAQKLDAKKPATGYKRLLFAICSASIVACLCSKLENKKTREEKSW